MRINGLVVGLVVLLSMVGCADLKGNLVKAVTVAGEACQKVAELPPGTDKDKLLEACAHVLYGVSVVKPILDPAPTPAK